MRIIAGSARGTTIHAPPGERVRPTSDRVRESLFSILRDRIVGAWVLDAYAGVGTVGLEALSRGAVGCDFIEADRGVLSYLRRNINKTHLNARARVFAQRVERFVAGWRETDEFHVRHVQGSEVLKDLSRSPEQRSRAFGVPEPWSHGHQALQSQMAELRHIPYQTRHIRLKRLMFFRPDARL